MIDTAEKFCSTFNCIISSQHGWDFSYNMCQDVIKAVEKVVATHNGAKIISCDCRQDADFKLLNLNLDANISIADLPT